LRPVPITESIFQYLLVGGALVVAIVGAAPRPVVDFSSSLWFVFSRRLAPARRRLALGAALLRYPSFYSIALVVEALELAAERFGVLTFVDVHGCCVLRLLPVVACCGFWEPKIALRCPGLVWGFYARYAKGVFGCSSKGLTRY